MLTSRICLAAVAVVGLALTTLLGACTAENSVTATCTPDTDKNGIHPRKDGCDQFAYCVDDNGHSQPVDTCCAGLKGSVLDECRFGYGVALPNGGSGGSAGSGGGGGGS